MKLHHVLWTTVIYVMGAGMALAQSLPTADPLDVGLSPQRLERVAGQIQKHVDEGRMAGAVVLVSRKGKVAYFEAIGQRDREASAPMQKDSIFRIYSMTKPVTSLAVMMLFERGHFLLSDPVSQYLPELGGLDVAVQQKDAETGEVTIENVPATQEITIQDLLRHTSGLTYGFFDQSPVDAMYLQKGVLSSDADLAETVAKLGDLPLKYQPGTKFEYSVSTDVLGRLVEVVSGQPLDKFFQEQIFEPLNMPDTAFHVAADKTDRLAQLYRANGDGSIVPGGSLVARDFTAPTKHFSGGGGLVSTATDYARFCQMMLNGGELDGVRLLGSQTVQWMTSDHLGDRPRSPLLRGYGFGLGFAVRPENGLVAFPGSKGDFFWGGAAGTGFFIDPAEELCAVLMIQNWMDQRYSAEFRGLVYQSIVD